MVFGVLDLLRNLWLDFSPLAEEVEEGRSSFKRVRSGPRDAVGAHGSPSPIEGLLGKHLDIGLGGIVVDNGVIVRVFGLGLLEALKQMLGVGVCVVVARVDALGNDLVHGMVLA